MYNVVRHEDEKRTGHEKARKALPLAYFSINELQLGVDQVSQGRYTVAYEIKSFEQDRRDENPLSQYSRDYVSKKATRQSNGERRYIIKHIRKEFMSSHAEFEAAASHLENEANILTRLHHPSIVPLRGTSTGGTEAYYGSGRHDAYFLIMENVSETLEQRLAKWKRKKSRMDVLKIGGLLKSNKGDEKFLLMRLSVASDIAEALKYMHSQKVVFRSFDRSKIGFDSRDQVRIMDLSDAVHLGGNPFNGVENDTQSLNSSWRPEHFPHPESTKQAHQWDLEPEAKRNSSGPESDVYFFTKLLSEIITLCVLQPGCSTRDANLYVKEFRRISQILPKSLLEVLQFGASVDQSQRPTMKNFCDELDLVIAELMVGGVKVGVRRCSSWNEVRARKALGSSSFSTKTSFANTFRLSGSLNFDASDTWESTFALDLDETTRSFNI